jgi:hypothetical protein
MLRREKRAQLVKNIIAESERVIEFGEHASIHTTPRVSLAAGPEKREYCVGLGSHPGNPGS